MEACNGIVKERKVGINAKFKFKSFKMSRKTLAISLVKTSTTKRWDSIYFKTTFKNEKRCTWYRKHQQNIIATNIGGMHEEVLVKLSRINTIWK